MATNPGHVTDHAGRSLSRLAEQVKSLPNWKAFLAVVVSVFQSAEDAAWDVMTLRQLATATGLQLDNLGTLVGEARQGRTDDSYRIRIQARIFINRSSGTIPEIIQVFNLIGFSARILEYYPASFELQVAGAVTTTPADLHAVLELMRPAGVGASIVYSLVDDAHTFVTSDATNLAFNPPGLGFGDSTNPATGGELAGVI